MINGFSTTVLHDGYIYGFSNTIFKCVNADTGEEKWKTRGFGQGSVIYADRHLIVLGENGNLALVEATPEAYREVAQVHRSFLDCAGLLPRYLTANFTCEITKR